MAKRLRLLHDLVPKAVRIAVLVNPANASTAETTLRDVQEAAPTIGLQIQILNATTIGEIDAAFATFARERPDALFVAPDAFFTSRRVQFATLTARNRIPAAYADRDYVAAGGLMSYGTDLADMFRQVGVYTGRILKGAKPADLPVHAVDQIRVRHQPQTARALGIEVPPAAALHRRRGDRMRAPRVHHASRRRGGGVAARGAGAAARADAAHRRAHEPGRGRSEGQAGIAAFQQALQQLGWIDGRNVRIDIRWGANDVDRDRKYAAELVALAPDVILAAGTPSVAALQHATRTLPIVFVRVTDPVGAGFVDSFAGRAATSQASCCSSIARAGNGWNCSSRSRRA